MSADRREGTLETQARPRLATKARLQRDRLRDELVLLYPEGVLLLNATAAAVAELCDGQCTVTEIVALLATRFEMPVDVLSQDVLEYLGQLRERGLLQRPTTEDAAS